MGAPPLLITFPNLGDRRWDVQDLDLQHFSNSVLMSRFERQGVTSPPFEPREGSKICGPGCTRSRGRRTGQGNQISDSQLQ